MVMGGLGGENEADPGVAVGAPQTRSCQPGCARVGGDVGARMHSSIHNRWVEHVLLRPDRTLW